ncbi:aminoglycoside phosphotransferase family protein [Streptomyces sp. URMC 129]|uniref:aminoglycoside phosphotransferase family protein n=1 Tax=Streptomyces sp. URMC 129 TaxID=3423407 RepID=UPI003F193C78
MTGRASASATLGLITVPAELVGYHVHFNGEAGRAWISGLPRLAARLLERWELTPTGPGHHGMVALVLPVVRADGSAAALKLQPPADEERAGEPAALRAHDGRGAVRLLDHDPVSGALLLEALDGDRSLAVHPDGDAALRVLTGLLGRLARTPPPPGMRHLRDIAGAMLDQVPDALPRLPRDDDRRLLADCAAATRELIGEPGDRLLHWDLHEENVLAPLPGAERGEPWLAIDPKPLVGDLGFDLLPALTGRFDPDAIRRRFDLMTEMLGLDRDRATGWTLARILQNGLWSVEDGEPGIDPEQVITAERLRSRPRAGASRR